MSLNCIVCSFCRDLMHFLPQQRRKYCSPGPQEAQSNHFFILVQFYNNRNRKICKWDQLNCYFGKMKIQVITGSSGAQNSSLEPHPVSSGVSFVASVCPIPYQMLAVMLSLAVCQKNEDKEEEL